MFLLFGLVVLWVLLCWGVLFFVLGWGCVLGVLGLLVVVVGGVCVVWCFCVFFGFGVVVVVVGVGEVVLVGGLVFVVVWDVGVWGRLEEGLREVVCVLCVGLMVGGVGDLV
ncbi:hypothetical protein BV373_29230, partial [Klebsiella pneumoniae]